MRIEIPMPVIKAICTVYIGYDKKTYKKLEKYGENTFDGSYMARCIYRLQNKDKMCFQTVIHSKSAAISVIAHEAVHAASFIQEGMGIIADFNNDELHAYIVQYICEQVENKLEKTNARTSN